MSFFVKAAIEALKAFPAVNAEIDGNDIVYKHYYDIGVAVGTEQGPGRAGACATPTSSASPRSRSEIADLAQAGARRQARHRGPEGGTFTITNGGIFGSLLSTPILNPPQSGILGMHTIQKRAGRRSDGQIVIRPMMYLALSYDHRIIDGREAVSSSCASRSARGSGADAARRVRHLAWGRSCKRIFEPLRRICDGPWASTSGTMASTTGPQAGRPATAYA